MSVYYHVVLLHLFEGQKDYTSEGQKGTVDSRSSLLSEEAGSSFFFLTPNLNLCSANLGFIKIKEAPGNLESTLPLIQERTCRSAMDMSPTCLTIYYWCRLRQEFNIGSIIKVMIRSWLGSISGHSYSLTWYFLHHCFEPIKYWNFVLRNWRDDLWWNLFLVTSAFRHLMTM